MHHHLHTPPHHILSVGGFDCTCLQCTHGQEMLDSGMCYVCYGRPTIVSEHAHLDYTYICEIPRVIWVCMCLGYM